jgi:hypothetical protein
MSDMDGSSTPYLAPAAKLGREGGQVEHVEEGVAPPLPGRPVVEVPEALVRRVQDRPQHRALRAPVGLRIRRLAFQDRRGFRKYSEIL